ncbi:Metallo-dependent phosphatase-like protein [Radiomyces spectabilis]|uniref:Metallo-dependent phosphatase-like protein n=1 Tax=Radiomyces spectabilis TaxID=64574 RepID=UPI0022204BB9|nr:Metallo-dependent phosphatase-like protein [Radiomyces spectabilis]KAI8391103.1 Metallo-dependent phosphatase-like protein [Radiomyces spectabilis]
MRNIPDILLLVSSILNSASFLTSPPTAPQDISDPSLPGQPSDSSHSLHPPQPLPSLDGFNPTKSHLTGRFIQVTDFHLDPTYLEGSDPSELCHRKSSYAGTVAGKFGVLGSKCDSPVVLVESAFQFMKKNLSDVDFIMYTGDSARHDRDKSVQPRTADDELQDQRAIVNYFTKTFDFSRIKIFPTIGNNDVYDNNIVEWKDPQFGKVKDLWKPFGLNLTQDFNDFGYFVQDIVKGKLRAVSVNTMGFLKKNKNVSDCDDPKSPGALHLQWLTQVLEDARRQNIKTYIIAHVPPNGKKDQPLFRDVCYTEYYKLLGTYADTILGHFAGHFNNDMLTAVLRQQTDYVHAAAVGSTSTLATNEVEFNNFVTGLFNAPSVVPVNNPAIRVYEYETKGGKYPVGTIRDWYQYYADINEANQSGQLTFRLEYQASKLFGVDHFDGDGLKAVFLKLTQDQIAQQDYNKFVTVSSEGEVDDDEDD